MTRPFRRQHKRWVSLICAVGLMMTACAPSGGQAPLGLTELPRTAPDCEVPHQIGRFNAPGDLLVINFDSKPDADDIHSVAAVATVLRDPRLACVHYIAVSGAYGTQGGKYIEASALFEMAFGEHSLDAHNNRSNVVAELGGRISQATAAGGEVWIVEAGQSDVTAAAVREAMMISAALDPQTQIHVVQHSEWNESQTTPDELGFVKSMTNYTKIPDGNQTGNGTPGFHTDAGDDWTRVLADPVNGAMWAEAKRVADAANPISDYVNPVITAGGFDFSDTAEIAWIFGFDDMHDHNDFFDAFLSPKAD